MQQARTSAEARHLRQQGAKGDAVRARLAVAVLDGKLYAAGGYNGGRGLDYFSSVERYDPAVGAWEAVAPMAAARMKAFAALM